MGNVLRLGQPELRGGGGREQRADMQAPDDPAQQLHRAPSLAPLASAPRHSMSQARMRWQWAFKVVRRVARLRKLWLNLGIFLKGMTKIKPVPPQLGSRRTGRSRPAR